MNKNIGILGCGWLGTALATALFAKGYHVKGSTTSRDKLRVLSEQGITPFQIHLGENRIEGDIDGILFDLDVLVINVPPNLRKQPQSNYVAKMESLLNVCKAAHVPYVIFISSTSVYGEAEGEITEETTPLPITSSGKQLLASEQLFLAEPSISASIIRFGGLIGGNRHPVYHLSGKQLTNGEELVNLIHRNDCIHMIETIMENGYWNEVFNGVYPYHPTKVEYYTFEAKKRGIPLPHYIDSPKEISKKKIHFKNFFVKNHDFTTSISS